MASSVSSWGCRVEELARSLSTARIWGEWPGWFPLPGRFSPVTDVRFATGLRSFGVHTSQHRGATSFEKRDMMVSTVPSPDSDPYADRRTYSRVPVALPAFLQANGERHAVQILDLSPAGAKLDCPVSLLVGTAVILDCGTLGLTAVVRWQSAGVMGLCFDSELHAREAS